MLAGSIIGLILISMVMASIATMMHSYVQTVNVKNVTQQAAAQLAQFNSAAAMYFNQTTSASAGATVNVAQLQSSGQLPNNFNPNSPLGQKLQAMYGGSNRVITYYSTPIPQSATANIGYRSDSDLVMRSLASRIAEYAASYTTGAGNISTGWSITKTKKIQLPMGSGTIDATQSVNAWRGLTYPSTVLMDNFKGLSYGY